MRTTTLLFTGALCLAMPFKTLAAPKGKPSIYGADDRIEISQIKDEKIKNLSHAIALITTAEYMMSAKEADGTDSGNYSGKYFSPDLPYDGLLHQDKRRFSNQANAGFCTGFLIDSTHLMTAGHCVQGGETCSTLRFVFDYTAEPIEGRQKPIIPAKNVKTCKRIQPAPNAVSTEGDELDSFFTADFAIVELSEAQTDRPTFKLTSATRKPIPGTTVAMLGHPSGKPMKYTAGGAQVLRSHGLLRSKTIVSEYDIVTNLDAFSGNSGSPVFEPNTLEVIGILVSGAEDTATYNLTVSDQTYPQLPEVKEINNAEARQGERVTAISTILDQILEVLKGEDAGK